MEKNQNLTIIVKESGLEETKSKYILEKFQDYFNMAAEWEVKAKSIVVTDISQTAEMKMAGEGRKFLKAKRVEVEHVRKELKEQSLREGKAIDGIANVLKALIEPIEQQLEQSEKFAEIMEKKMKEERKLERIEKLQQYVLDVSVFDLLNMSNEAFDMLFIGSKKTFEDKIAAEKKAEEERIAKEKAEYEERERIRKENERLKLEAIERENAAKIEREKQEKIISEQKAKAEAESKKQAEMLAKLKKEADEKLKKEREEKEKLEAELKAKAEAEEKEKTRIENEKKEKLIAEKKAASLSDSKKLIEWIDGIKATYEIKGELSKDAEIIANTIIEKFSSFKNWAKTEINKLKK